MERLKDQKADQKRLSPGTSFGDRSLQRFRLRRGGPQVKEHSEEACGAHVFERFFDLENGPVNRTKARRRRCLAKIFPNPPRHSRSSVSDGVIQLRVPLAGCASFFLQAPIPRRILTKMFGAFCCMNMRFAKRSWEHPCFYCFPPQRGCTVVRLGNNKLCEFLQRGACTISV